MKPRDRIASHLRRILVAAGMAIPQPGHADTTVPPGGKGKPEKPNKPPEGKKKPRERLGYEVVDMMPEPYIEEKGTLEVRSDPAGAAIWIDGKDINQKTPLSGYRLAVGRHAVSLRTGGQQHNFVVEIRADQTTVESRSLKPSPAPEPKK